MDYKKPGVDSFMALLLLVLATVLASLLVLSTASAQGDAPTGPSSASVTDDAVNAVAKKLYCPVCPNTPLDVCETKACQDWRAQIRDQLSRGWSEQEIMDYFVAQYGERVLGEPQRKGFTSLVWMLPLIALLLGLGAVWLVVKGWRARNFQAAGQGAAPPAVDPKIMAKIEKELQELD